MSREFTDSSTVFVYGTLRPGQPNFEAVADRVDVRGPARLRDYELWALPEGYPTILPGSGPVVGTVLNLDDTGEARRVMNRIEGYDPDGDRSLYRPRPVTVETDDGDVVETFAYVMHPNRHRRVRDRGVLVEHGNWIPWSRRRER